MSVNLSTFSGTISVTGTSNQIVLGTTNTTTLTAVAPAASRVYTLIDAGASAQVVLTEGTQTINGTKTWSGNSTMSGNIGIPLPIGGSGTTGVITAGGIRYIHNYSPSANYNLCMGVGAGNFSLSGVSNCFIGSQTIAKGAPGGVATSAGANTVIGSSAGASITTASSNVLIGSNAGVDLTTGTANIIIGSSNAGASFVVGNNNIIIGGSISAGVGSNSNCIAITSGTLTVTPNRITIGTSGTHTSCRIAGISGAISSSGVGVLINAVGTLGTTTSSQRFKENIVDLPDALVATLLAVPLKQFTYISDESHEIQYGAIAETVLPLWPEVIVYDEDGVTPNTIQYHKWVPVLVKIVQLQQTQIAQMQASITALQS